MNDTWENESFEYTYSAKEQEEIKAIREKYTKPEKKEETPIEKLRRLDASVTRKADILSLITGILGLLILGTGMSLIMTDLGTVLGDAAIISGIIIGLVGICATSLAYPIYLLVVKRERKKIAPEIIRISEELMN